MVLAQRSGAGPGLGDRAEQELDLARATGGPGSRLVNAWWAAWLSHMLTFPLLAAAFALADYRGSSMPWLGLTDAVAAGLIIPVIRQLTAAQRALLTSP